jgi:hypothetical protein
MKAGELIVGRKYVPINKTVMGGFNTSVVWKRAIKKNQYFLYYIGQDENGCYLFSNIFNDKIDGDYFLPEDVIPYVEPQKETAIPFLQSLSESMPSKREIFAAMAMQGMLANNSIALLNYDIVAERSLKAADALIAELNKTI